MKHQSRSAVLFAAKIRWPGGCGGGHGPAFAAWIDKGAGIFMAMVETGLAWCFCTSTASTAGRVPTMMRWILVGILVLMAAAVGFMTFNWYR